MHSCKESLFLIARLQYPEQISNQSLAIYWYINTQKVTTNPRTDELGHLFVTVSYIDFVPLSICKEKIKDQKFKSIFEYICFLNI